MTQDLTKHTTAQVVTALSKHHDWTAEAPQIGLLAEQKAHTEDGGRWGFSIVFQDRLHTWELSQRFIERSDWTIRRADGSIVERKARRKHVKIGRLNFVKKHNDHGIYYDTRFSPEKGVNYNLFAVRKP
jgi:hypothetical protein